MAARKVTLRTAFNDRFTLGDVTIDQAGVEVSSRAKADELIEAARQSGVILHEVETDDVPATDNKKEGGGS